MNNDPFGGIDSPSEPLRLSSYAPAISRSCVDCGKKHNTILEEMATGKVLQKFDQCKDCLLNSWLESCKKHWETHKIDINWTEEDLKEWAQTKEKYKND